MNQGDGFSTAEAAKRLGITQVSARQLSESGQLAALERVDRSLLLDRSSVERLAAAGTRRGPAWTAKTAWAALAILSGQNPTWISASEKSRLKSRLREMDADAVAIMARNKDRTFRYRATADAPRGAVSAFCRKHNVSRAWFYQVRAAAVTVGLVKALEKKSPAPLTRPTATAPGMNDLLLASRAELEQAGFDHGPLSVIAKLTRQGFDPPFRATVARIFSRAGVVVPEPRKKPRSAYKRFTFPQPNAFWQIDPTEWLLADGTKGANFQLVDDHSRLALAAPFSPGPKRPHHEYRRRQR